MSKKNLLTSFLEDGAGVNVMAVELSSTLLDRALVFKSEGFRLLEDPLITAILDGNTFTHSCCSSCARTVLFNDENNPNIKLNIIVFVLIFIDGVMILDS